MKSKRQLRNEILDKLNLITPSTSEDEKIQLREDINNKINEYFEHKERFKTFKEELKSNYIEEKFDKNDIIHKIEYVINKFNNNDYKYPVKILTSDLIITIELNKHLEQIMIRTDYYSYNNEKIFKFPLDIKPEMIFEKIFK